MNTKDVEPLEIVAAANGVIVRKSINNRITELAIHDVMVFNGKEDLFAYLEGYFIKENDE